MKRITTVCLLILTFNISAQINGAGLQTKVNLSSQLFKNPETPQHGTEGTHSLTSLGADFFIDYSLNEKFTIRLKGGYEQKGFVNNKHQTNLEGQTIKTKLDYAKFNYISSDLVINYSFTGKNIKPYAIAGISTGYLLNKTYYPNNDFEFANWNMTEKFNEQYKSYSNYNLGLLVGIGINFKNIFWTELEFNPDIIAPITTSNFILKNDVFSFNLGINLLELFKK